MSNNEQFKKDAAQWKELQSFFEKHRAWSKLAPWFSLWKNGKKITFDEFRSAKPKVSIVGSQPINKSNYKRFTDLFKTYCVLKGDDKDTAINPLFLAAMQEVFEEQIHTSPPPTTVSPPPPVSRKPVREENRNTPPYTIAQTPPLTFTTTNQNLVPPRATPPPSPVENPDVLDIVSIFVAPSLCAVASGITFLLLSFSKLRVVHICLILSAFLIVGMFVARIIPQKLKVTQKNLHFGKALSLILAYEIFSCWILNSYGAIWYYSLPVIFIPFLVTAKSFTFIRDDYPKSKFALLVLILSLIPFLSTGGFFAYNAVMNSRTVSVTETPPPAATTEQAPVTTTEQAPVTTTTQLPVTDETVQELCRKGEEHYNRKEYSLAVKYFQKAATMGNVVAQFNLGNCYYFMREYNKAVEWYQKASEHNNADAQFNLGVCYAEGSGVSQDWTTAVTWYRKAAKQNHVHAQYNMGDCYEYGRGVPKDFEKAAAWYKKAFDQGDAKAQEALVRCFAALRNQKKNVEATGTTPKTVSDTQGDDQTVLSFAQKIKSFPIEEQIVLKLALQSLLQLNKAAIAKQKKDTLAVALHVESAGAAMTRIKERDQIMWETMKFIAPTLNEMVSRGKSINIEQTGDWIIKEYVRRKGNKTLRQNAPAQPSNQEQQEQSAENMVSSRAGLRKKFDEILMRLPAKASFKLIADFDHFSVSGSSLYMTAERSPDVVGTVTDLANTAAQVVDLATNRGRTRRYVTPTRRQQPRIEYRIKEKAFEPDIASCFYQSTSGQYENYAFNQYLDRPRVTRIPLISPTRDKFDFVKSRLSDSTASARDVGVILEQMEKGTFSICRYVVNGKFRSYSERHVKTTQRSNRINFTIYYNIIIDVEIIDRLTGKTQMRQYTVPVTNNSCWAVFGSNLRSTDELKNNRADVFKVAARKFMNSLMEDLARIGSL